MTVKLTQRKRKSNNKNSVCLVRVLDLLLWHPILVLLLGILGFVGYGAASIIRQFEMK
jgi:hypothetical protein